MYDWIIENSMEGCQELHRMRSRWGYVVLVVLVAIILFLISN